jgi:hypothetical protein
MTSPTMRAFPEQIDSDRLIIRCPRPGDWRAVFEAVSESLQDLRRFRASLPWAMHEPSVARSEVLCREGNANFLARKDLPMLLFLKDTGTLVGGSGLHRFDWNVPRFEVG